MSLYEWNKLAKENGNFCERFVKEKLPDVEWIEEPVDCKLGDVYIEVKSCLLKIREGERERAGRFWFKKEQQEFLEKTGGLYILLVHDGVNVLYSRMIKASILPRDFKEAKAVTWWKLFNDISLNNVLPSPLLAC